MSNTCIQIAGRRVGAGEAPYVIAEMSANHNGSLETAKRIITEARARGADAVKLQTYRPDTITLESDAEEFCIRGGLWDGKTLHDLYAEAHMPWEWHAPLFEHAREEGITIFSSPFDDTAVELLETFDAPAYKIASFEVVDLPLIRRVARTGKPLILSTGMADAEEIGEAVEAARSAGCEELALLHCVSGYPAPAGDYNLRTLVDMAERFECVVGLSDHTLDNTTAVSSVAMGAALVEKHFTLDRSGGGPDDSFSLEPDGLEELCRNVRTAWEALGEVDYGRKSSEQGNVQFRRSLYWIRDMQAGEVVDATALRSVRPGYGLAPKHLDEVLGLHLARAVSAKTPVRREDLDS
jgi:pseudaminic acid synthase